MIHTTHTYGDSLSDFHLAQRVETHPGTNAWIFGDRFGTVTKLGRAYVHVKMDVSGRTLRFTPDRLRLVE